MFMVWIMYKIRWKAKNKTLMKCELVHTTVESEASCGPAAPCVYIGFGALTSCSCFCLLQRERDYPSHSEKRDRKCILFLSSQKTVFPRVDRRQTWIGGFCFWKIISKNSICVFNLILLILAPVFILFFYFYSRFCFEFCFALSCLFHWLKFSLVDNTSVKG